MIQGRRARKVRGSSHDDRPDRRGASVTGVCQCATRAFSMWCRLSIPCTDRSWSGHLLELSSHPDLGSGCQLATRKALEARTYSGWPAWVSTRGEALEACRHRCAAYSDERPPGFAVALQRALNGPLTGESPSPRGLGPQRVERWPVCPARCPPPSAPVAHCRKRIANAHRGDTVIGTTEIP